MQKIKVNVDYLRKMYEASLGSVSQGVESGVMVDIVVRGTLSQVIKALDKLPFRDGNDHQRNVDAAIYANALNEARWEVRNHTYMYRIPENFPPGNNVSVDSHFSVMIDRLMDQIIKAGKVKDVNVRQFIVKEMTVISK